MGVTPWCGCGRYYNVHVNKAMATYRADKSVVIVLSHIDPGLAGVNWLTTAHHTCGTMSFRWVKPQVPDDLLPYPQTSVVKAADVAEAISQL